MLNIGTAIGQFWQRVAFDEDASHERLALLRRFSEIVVKRDPDAPTPEAIRAESRRMPLPSRRCFACRAINRGLQAHHIIEVQHGGTNADGNRVSLCASCHCALHPWLNRGKAKYFSRRDRGSHEWVCTNPALRVTPVRWREPEDEPEEAHGMGSLR